MRWLTYIARMVKMRNDVEQGGRKPLRRHTATKSFARDSDDDTHVAT